MKAQNDQDYSFYISAEYNFDERIWRSWRFEIESGWWKDSETNDYKYPILYDHMFFYNNFVKQANITGDLKELNMSQFIVRLRGSVLFYQFLPV